MNEESTIHVRVDYVEALESKRNILSSEMHILKMLGAIERYKLLRVKEASLKETLNKKIKELRNGIKHLEKILPKGEVPKTIRKIKEEPEEKMPKEKTSNSIEAQLLEIQRRIDKLQRENI